jgi:hypothetical protein
MTRKLLLPAIVACLGFGADAHAQYVVGPGFFPGGLSFQYSTGRFRVAGYLPAGAPPGYFVPYPGPVVAVIERRIVLQPVAPAPSPPILVPEYDLSGIDLDVESPDRLYPPGAAPKPPPRIAEARLPAVKRPPPEPGNEPPPPAPVKKLPVDELLEPRAGAAEESQRLVGLGVRAFRAAEYGLALWRFRQASEVDPNHARAFFLLGQAHLAVGQYREAIAAIRDGLKLQPNWPTTKFQPRIELYALNLDDWLDHRQRLDDGVNRQPKDPTLLFLRGYLAWFDGQRPQAASWFLRARPLTLDPRWIDLFLKHAPPPAVAAS